jgi:hypothetical protein
MLTITVGPDVRLCDALLRVSAMVEDLPQSAELDLNHSWCGRAAL